MLSTFNYVSNCIERQNIPMEIKPGRLVCLGLFSQRYLCVVVLGCMLFSDGGGGFTLMQLHTAAELLMEQRWRLNCAAKVFLFNYDNFTCMAGYHQQFTSYSPRCVNKTAQSIENIPSECLVRFVFFDQRIPNWNNNFDIFGQTSCLDNIHDMYSKIELCIWSIVLLKYSQNGALVFTCSSSIDF